MTVYEKAKQLAENGMNKKAVFRFFDQTWKGVRDPIDYIILFTSIGVAEKNITVLIEEWQDLEVIND